MQQVADVAVGCWPDTWPGTIQDTESNIDIAETYEVMTGMCEDEKVEELNL